MPDPDRVLPREHLQVFFKPTKPCRTRLGNTEWRKSAVRLPKILVLKRRRAASTFRVPATGDPGVEVTYTPRSSTLTTTSTATVAPAGTSTLANPTSRFQYRTCNAIWGGIQPPFLLSWKQAALKVLLPQR